jgi:hypothetical protein
MTRLTPLVLFAAVLLPRAVHSEPIPADATYRYEARMALINAGILSLELGRENGIYEVLGQFSTSRAMNKYYSWNGLFAAKGDWQDGDPQTKAYLTLSKSSDDGYKVVIYTAKGTRRMRKAREPFEDHPQPQGVDLISALFISPDCFKGARVHDGEDDYEIKLLKRKPKELIAAERYYSGPGIQCDYQVRDNKGRKRRIQIVLAEVQGNTVAVAASVKIPLLPDPAFRLLKPKDAEPETVRTSSAQRAPKL